MFAFLVTGLGALLTVRAESDNQRAIGAAVLAVGLNRALVKMEV